MTRPLDHAELERLEWLEAEQRPGPAMALALAAGMIVTVLIVAAGAFYVGVWFRLALYHLGGV